MNDIESGYKQLAAAVLRLAINDKDVSFFESSPMFHFYHQLSNCPYSQSDLIALSNAKKDKSEFYKNISRIQFEKTKEKIRKQGYFICRDFQKDFPYLSNNLFRYLLELNNISIYKPSRWLCIMYEDYSKAFAVFEEFDKQKENNLLSKKEMHLLRLDIALNRKLRK